MAGVLAGILCAASCSTFATSFDARVQLPDHDVRVPVVFDDGVPLVEVRINGQGPFLFKVDTGSGPCVVAQDLVDRLRLPTVRVRGSLTGANGETRAVDRLAEIATMNLGEEAVLADVRAFVLGSQDLDVHSARRPVLGILGYAIFSHCTLVIDYRRGVLELSKQVLPAADGDEVLVMTVQSKTPRVRMGLAGQAFDVLIDTGNDQGLILTDAAGDALPFLVPPQAGPLLSTVSGTVRVRIGRLDGELTLGRHTIAQPVVSLMPCSGPMIGAELLMHFRLSLDARSGRVRFERQREAPLTVESRVSDGLGLRRLDDGWEVVDVIPGSPADEAAVRVGDLVRSIDYAGSGRYRVAIEQRDGTFREVLLRAAVLVK